MFSACTIALKKKQKFLFNPLKLGRYLAELTDNPEKYSSFCTIVVFVQTIPKLVTELSNFALKR